MVVASLNYCTVHFQILFSSENIHNYRFQVKKYSLKYLSRKMRCSGLALMSVLLLVTVTVTEGRYIPSDAPCESVCDTTHFLCLRTVETVVETFTCAQTRNLCFRCCRGDNYGLQHTCSKFNIPISNFDDLRDARREYERIYDNDIEHWDANDDFF